MYSQTVQTPHRQPTVSSPTACRTVTALQTNHAKNYVAVPLAYSAEQSADDILFETVGGDAKAAKDGAKVLGLTAGPALTETGRELVTAVCEKYGSVDGGLKVLRDLYGRQTRLITACPEMKTPLWDGIAAHPALNALCHILRTCGPLRLPELYRIAVQSPAAALQDSLRHPTDYRTNTPADTAFYHASTISHLKSSLYHAGVLTERGTTTDSHNPTTDTWSLEPTFEEWFDGY
jgi:hypothetical protein